MHLSLCCPNTVPYIHKHIVQRLSPERPKRWNIASLSSVVKHLSRSHSNMCFRLVQALQLPVHFLVLLQEQEGCNCVRSKADERRHPTPEHPSHPLEFVHISQEFGQPLTLLRGHDTGLDDIHRGAHGSSNKSGQKRSREVSCQVV